MRIDSTLMPVKNVTGHFCHLEVSRPGSFSASWRKLIPTKGRKGWRWDVLNETGDYEARPSRLEKVSIAHPAIGG